ncbi:MAG: hemolysin family protein [Verrucomicrobiales bacterium]
MGASESIEVILKLGLVMFLVFLNGFFVAAEFALVKVRDTQLEHLVIRGHKRAKVARKLLSNLDAALSATQLGITLASLGLGWVGEPVFASLLHPLLVGLNIHSPELQHSISFAVGFSVITFLHIVVGELAPKSLAIQKPLPVTLWVANPMVWFNKLSFPFIWLLNKNALWLLRRVGVEPVSEAEMIHSQEELRLLFTAAQEHSGGTTLGREVVLNAMDLNRRHVRDVMRPRREIVGLDTTSTISECLDVAEKTRYSRFPLCVDGDLDQTYGVVHFKDLFAMRIKAKSGKDLVSVAKKIIFVPSSCRLEKLLQLFLDRRLHFALVIDEFGTTIGMITLENILEELVGQIQDEFDQEKPLIRQIAPDKWALDGAFPLHELSELIGEPLEEEDVSTTSGYVTHKLSGFPKVGDKLELTDFVLVVDQMAGPQVASLTLTKRFELAQTEKEN